jgi:hypothetical protein
MKSKFLSLLAFLTLTAILFNGCKSKDDNPDYSALALGTWVNTQINSTPVLTDDAFIMELLPDHTELYAIGFQLDETSKIWKENSNYTYTIVNDLIVIDGVDIFDIEYHMEFKIITLNQETLMFSIPAFSIDGVEIPNPNIFTCNRVADDFSTEFTGVWYGKCTSDNTADTAFHYWEYFADGTYNYYYQDEDEKWIKKSDNEGRYFLYGDLFVSNYSNDLISGGTGLAYECWNFNITGNTMIWNGLRENNITVTYQMDKVASPPETR